MSDTNIESLQLEITSNADSAISGITALAESLGKIKEATKGGLGLGGIATQISQINQASANGTTANNISNLAVSLGKLKSLGELKLSSSIANQLKALAESGKTLNGMSFRGITDLSASLKGLSEINKGTVGSMITQLKKLPEVMDAMKNSDLDKFADDMKRLSNALVPLSTQMERVGRTFQQLPAQVSKLVTASSRAASAMNKYKTSVDATSNSNYRSVKSFTDISQKLQLFARGLSRGITTIMGFVKESNAYIENINLFTASMGKYAQEAQNYANVVSEALGIDPSEWMRNQGVFNTIISGFGVASDKAYIMSKNLTQLGYDISSFFNIDFETSMQKLQSGISGELEPLRRLGYDLSVARLQQEAYSLGIEKSVNNMTQAEKSMLRYHAIMTQVSVSHTDMARTIQAPANQIRVLQAQFTQCARAIGNIFIPILNAILPVAIAVIQVIRGIADAIASLFGFKLPEVDYSGLSAGAAAVGDLADSADDASGGLGGAAKKAKELKNALLGIDELNVISPPEDTGAGGGGGGGGAGGLDTGFDFELPTYDFLEGFVAQTDKLKEKIEALLPVLGLLATALGALKVYNAITKGLGEMAGALTKWDKLSFVAGVVMAVAGAMSYFWGIFDVIKKGANWKNIGAILGGIALAVTGVWLAVKPFSTNWAGISAGVLGIVAAFGALNVLGKDMRKNGTNWSSLAGNLALVGGAIGSAVLASSKLKAMSGTMKGWGGVIANGIGQIMAPLVAVTASLVAFNNFLSDLLINGPSTQNVLGTVATAIAGVAASIWLVHAAVSAFGVIGGVIAAVTALVGWIWALDSAYEAAAQAAYEATDDFAMIQKIGEESAAISERCAQGMENLANKISALDEVSTQFGTARTLVDAIFEISENANKTDAEFELMKTYVETLNSMGIEGLQLSVDETTRSVTQTKDEIYKVIEALENQAKMAALQDVLTEAYKNQTTSLRDLNRSMENQKTLQEKLDEITQQYNDSLITTYWGSTQETAASRELRLEMEHLQEELDNNNQAMLDSFNMYIDNTGAIDDYTLALLESQLQMQGYSTEEIQTALDDLKNKVKTMPGEVFSAAELLGKSIPEGVAKGVTDNTGTVNTAVEGMSNGAIDISRERFKTHSPSKVFSEIGGDVVDGFNEGITNNTGSTQTAMGSWAGIATDGFTSGQKGINGQNFNTISAGAVAGFNSGINSNKGNSQGTMGGWASSAVGWFTDGKNGMNANTFQTVAGDAAGGFNTGIGLKAAIAMVNMAKFATTSIKFFTDIMNSSKFESIAKDVIDGFNNGINNYYRTTQPYMTKWANAAAAAYKAALDSNSPSKLFMRIGGDTVEGFNIGIEKNMKSTEESMRTWAQSAIDSFSVDTSSLDIYKGQSFNKSLNAQVQSSYEATVTPEGTETALRDFYYSTLAPTMNQMAEDMRRQADKEESTQVVIGGKTITDTIATQQRANGYSFTKGAWA